MLSKPNPQHEQEQLSQQLYKAQVAQAVSPTAQKAAFILSLIFHPLFLVLYIYLMLAYINPYFFGKTSFESVMTDKHDFGVFMLLLFMLVLLPIFAMGMMRGLGMISNFALEDRQERTGPYIVIGLSYLVGYMHLNNYTGAPIVVKLFLLGAAISIAIAFFINLFAKISIHAVGMGGAVAFTFLALINTSVLGETTLFVLPLVVLIAGLVGTSRRILAAHQPQELYFGYFIGFFAQFLSLNFV